MKIKIFLYILIFLSFFLYCVNTVSAKIWLNEIYPAPQSPEKEWIELYNDEDREIDLSNYSLIDDPPANNKITFETTLIPAYGFIIATSYNVLNNPGDTVFLKNSLGEIIETATYSGTFTSDKTYAKCPNGNGNWYTLTMTTKNSSNEIACLVLTPTVTPTPIITPTETSTPTPQPTPTPFSTSEVTITPTDQTVSYDNIYISEVMVNPESGEKEWVELFNNNDFSVSLNNWYIDDLENAGAAPKIFSLDISGKSYEVYQLTSSVFNNNGDHVRLLDFNKNLKDSFEYLTSSQGKTWGRIGFDNDNFCLQEPSKNSPNNSCVNPTSNPTSTNVPTQQPTTNEFPITKYQFPMNSRLSSTNNLKPINSFTMSLSNGLIRNNEYFNNSQSPEVLGANTNQQSISKSSNQTKGLSFISISYSLLTIASLLIKMKVNG